MSVSTAVDATAVARVVGIKTDFKDLRGGNAVTLPQRIGLIGQGASATVYSTDKHQITSALDAALRYGFGSPIHLAARQLFPANGDGVGTIPVTVYPLEDATSSVAAAGDITPAGAPTEAGAYRVVVNNIRSEAFVISVGDTVADIIAATVTAINAVLEMPVIAAADPAITPTRVTITAKWAGLSGNDLRIAIEGPTDAGVTFAITQPTSGLINPSVQPALDQIGNVWETMLLNCLNPEDTAAFDALSTFGEGRWGALVRKPLVAFTGSTAVTVADAIAIPDARKTDRTNVQLVAPGSDDLPLAVAARQLVRIARLANNNPAHDYGSQPATGLTPGADGVQWNYAQRDQAVKGGSSTVEVRDGVINISDAVTFYHPTGDPTPAYRFVVDIVKLQNTIFNIDLRFAVPEWDGAPLIPDDQPTANRDAKKPKMAKAVAAAIIDGLGLAAIISDPAAAKESIIAAIDIDNPKRLNLSVTVQLSGNTNIISIDLNFGFFFGTATLAA